MKLELKYLLVVALAIVLATPITAAIQQRTSRLRIEKKRNSELRLQLKTKQQKIEELQKQAEAKRVEKARLAVIAAQPKPPVYVSGNCESYRPLVSKYNWDVNVAMAVMQAESSCREVTPDNSALNYDGVPDHGLFQLHGINVTDPAENVRIAYSLKYVTQGWRAWNAYSSGAYLRFL